jgi:DHA1 family multidrug resistance protein-like MFS transporter
LFDSIGLLNKIGCIMNAVNTANRKNLYILSFTLFVVMLGYGMVMPIMPFYIEHLGVGGTELGWLMAAYSLMQLIFAPIWGVLSDRYGRKPILSVGVLGYAIALLMFGLSTEFWMLFIARSLSGILSSATNPTAMAYISDNAPEKERSKGMGQLGAAVGIGVIFGPLMGGYLSANSFTLPFLVGSALAFLALLLIIFLLPESKNASLPMSELVQSNGQNPGPQPDSTTRLRTRDIYLQIFFGPAGVLLLLIFIMSFGMTNFQGMIGLYVVDKFAFNTKQVGAIWMIMGLALIIVQGGLTGPLSKKLGDLTLIRIGLLGGAIGFLFVALAVDYATILLALGVFISALALIGPALNSYISIYAGEHQGTVMGLNSAMTSLGRVVGPLWGGTIYDISIEYPFFSGAATLLLGLFVSFVGIKKQAPESPTPAELQKI